MKTKAVSVKRVTPVSLPNLPDGKFEGSWSGKTAVVEINDMTQLVFETVDGIHSVNGHCIVTINDGSVEIETLE